MNQILERFNSYVNRYQKLIMVNAEKFVDHQTAEDVSQDTFLKMLQHMEYLDESTVKQWLIVVSGNIAKDYLKKMGRTELHNMNTLEQEMLNKHQGDSAETCFEQEEKRKAANRLLETACQLLYEKNPVWCFVLIDCGILGLKSSEIAKALHLTTGNVDVIRSRARKYLKKHLGKDFSDIL